MVRHRFLEFGSYVETVQTVRSVFFLDLREFLHTPQYYTTWRQISQVPPPRHILYHNFSEMQKNKKINLVSTLTQWDLSKNALK
jgi:hypothetical protein